MQLYQQLNAISDQLRRLRVPREQFESVERVIKFLISQSLCDYDRRASRENRADAVNSLLTALQEISFHSMFRVPENFLIQLHELAEGSPRMKLKLVPKDKTPLRKAPPHQEWGPKDLVLWWLNEVRKFPESADKNEMLKVLDYLFRESEEVKYKRDQAQMQAMWKFKIYDLLAKQGLTQPFEKSDFLVSKFLFFIKGNFNFVRIRREDWLRRSTKIRK